VAGAASGPNWSNWADQRPVRPLCSVWKDAGTGQGWEWGPSGSAKHGEDARGPSVSRPVPYGPCVLWSEQAGLMGAGLAGASALQRADNEPT